MEGVCTAEKEPERRFSTEEKFRGLCILIGQNHKDLWQDSMYQSGKYIIVRHWLGGFYVI